MQQNYIFFDEFSLRLILLAVKEYYVIGLMSGTSLDGLDIAYCKFVKTNCWSFEILKFNIVKYSKEIQKLLRSAYEKNQINLDHVSHEFGLFMSNEVKCFTVENNIERIDLIASHGHTIFHKPEEGITLQIGSPKPIYDVMNIEVIYDFRIQDVQLGGQGAPLVPIVDKMLFSDYDACLNLGGFSNISFDCENQRVAFDICPVNIVLNSLANNLGLEYDHKGAVAKNSFVDIALLNKLNSISYYNKAYPKSLALEWVDEFITPLLLNSNIETGVLLRTFTEHIAIQIAEVIQKYNLKKVLITGGGAWNDFLIDRIDRLIPKRCELASTLLIEGKEAMAFAFLGLLKYKNEVNVLASVTGSIKNHSSGKLYQG